MVLLPYSLTNKSCLECQSAMHCGVLRPPYSSGIQFNLLLDYPLEREWPAAWHPSCASLEDGVCSPRVDQVPRHVGAVLRVWKSDSILAAWPHALDIPACLKALVTRFQDDRHGVAISIEYYYSR